MNRDSHTASQVGRRGPGQRSCLGIAGSYHTRAATTAGIATCWGYNNVYELGDSTNTGQLVPTEVATSLTIRDPIFSNGFEALN
ncbi:MAG: hypothetical protein ABI411_00635 [Tahibacter sp.]